MGTAAFVRASRKTSGRKTSSRLPLDPSPASRRNAALSSAATSSASAAAAPARTAAASSVGPASATTMTAVWPGISCSPSLLTSPLVQPFEMSPAAAPMPAPLGGRQKNRRRKDADRARADRRAHGRARRTVDGRGVEDLHLAVRPLLDHRSLERADDLVVVETTQVVVVRTRSLHAVVDASVHVRSCRSS